MYAVNKLGRCLFLVSICTLPDLIDVPLRLFFWGKNSGATALFDGGMFNENLMVLLRTILILKDICIA